MKIQAKVELLGSLRRGKDGVLRKDKDILINPMGARQDFGLPPLREAPNHAHWQDYDRWDKERESWVSKAFASEGYQNLMSEILEIQQKEPFWYAESSCVFRDRVYWVGNCEGLTREEMSLLVQHFAVSQQQQFKRLSREIRHCPNWQGLRTPAVNTWDTELFCFGWLSTKREDRWLRSPRWTYSRKYSAKLGSPLGKWENSNWATGCQEI